MKLGINYRTSLLNADESFDIDGSVTTAKDLLDKVKLGHIDKCRFLKVPKTDKDKLQTIEINPSNINSTLAAIGFQDNATYTVISLI